MLKVGDRVKVLTVLSLKYSQGEGVITEIHADSYSVKMLTGQ